MKGDWTSEFHQIDHDQPADHAQMKGDCTSSHRPSVLLQNLQTTPK